MLLVKAILRRVRANVTLRLGNLQVVNRFDDGEERFAHDWLRQNERDMASLAWEMAAVREHRGFGLIKVLHQPGHPGKRKVASDYDEHERYNIKVDALTHAITPDMPLYISFCRTGRRQTQLWYEPTEHENVGHVSLLLSAVWDRGVSRALGGGRAGDAIGRHRPGFRRRALS